jgi:hypothetical protein
MADLLLPELPFFGEAELPQPLTYEYPFKRFPAIATYLAECCSPQFGEFDIKVCIDNRGHHRYRSHTLTFSSYEYAKSYASWIFCAIFDLEPEGMNATPYNGPGSWTWLEPFLMAK